MNLWFVIEVVLFIASLILYFLPPTRLLGICIFIVTVILGVVLLVHGLSEKNDDVKFKKTTAEQIDQLLKAQKKYMKEQFEIQQTAGRLISANLGPDEGPYQLIFGSNSFIGLPNILVVGGIPLVTMKVVNGALLVSTVIYDEEGRVLALIKDNEWIFERSENLKKEVRINSVKIWDNKNRLLLDCEMLSNRRIALNGIFRKDGAEIIATNEGMTIKSSGKSSVELG
ncbi:MAG: hypothetical protein WC530_09665 [Candidatus Omnitrophota bacterium]